MQRLPGCEAAFHCLERDRALPLGRRLADRGSERFDSVFGGEPPLAAGRFPCRGGPRRRDYLRARPSRVWQP
jgi:hypothetical protein